MVAILPRTAHVFAASPHSEFNRLPHEITINHGDFMGLLRLSHHSDSHGASKMLAEPLEPVKKSVMVAHGIAAQWKSKRLQAARDATDE